MARWALRANHYLKVADNEYEYIETDRATGRAHKHKWQVPRYFSPEDPNDMTYPPDVTVCYDGKGLPRDHVFFGPPTPDMEPMDEEAVKISDALKPSWINAMGAEAFPAQGAFSDALLAGFERSLNEIVRKVGIPQAANTSLAGVEPSVLEQLQKRIAELEAKMAGESVAPLVVEPIEDLTEEELKGIEQESLPLGDMPLAPPASALSNAPLRRV